MTVEISPITDNETEEVRLILCSVLPVTYPPSFYKSLASGILSGVIARYKNKPVGCLVFDGKSEETVQILAIGVLVLYRERGIASAMLETCLAQLRSSQGHKKVILHVQTDNETAVAFYQQRGFAVTETIANYYKRVECTNAFKMEYINK